MDMIKDQIRHLENKLMGKKEKKRNTLKCGAKKYRDEKSEEV